MKTAATNLAARMMTARRHGIKWTDTDIIPDPGDRPILHVSYGPEEGDVESYEITGADVDQIAEALDSIRTGQVDALCDAAEALGLPDGEYQEADLRAWLREEAE